MDAHAERRSRQMSGFGRLGDGRAGMAGLRPPDMGAIRNPQAGWLSQVRCSGVLREVLVAVGVAAILGLFVHPLLWFVAVLAVAWLLGRGPLSQPTRRDRKMSERRRYPTEGDAVGLKRVCAIPKPLTSVAYPWKLGVGLQPSIPPAAGGRRSPRRPRGVGRRRG